MLFVAFRWGFLWCFVDAFCDRLCVVDILLQKWNWIPYLQTIFKVVSDMLWCLAVTSGVSAAYTTGRFFVTYYLLWKSRFLPKIFEGNKFRKSAVVVSCRLTGVYKGWRFLLLITLLKKGHFLSKQGRVVSMTTCRKRDNRHSSRWLWHFITRVLLTTLLFKNCEAPI